MPIRPTIPNSPIMDGSGRNPPYMPPDYKIYLLNKRLQERNEDDNLWWDAVINEFFEEKSTLTISVYMEDGPKRYTIGRTLIPRYFRSIFDGGATDLYFVLKHPKDLFNPATNSITMDCEHTTMVTQHLKPVLTKVCTEGHLFIEFSYDDLMRIRSWHFEIRGHSELIPKQLMLQEPGFLKKVSAGITKQGMTSSTVNYLKLCVILEPMKEIMSRHKTYNIDPRDCLRNCLFQKWQRMMNPPAENVRTPKRNSRKRKNSSSNNSGNPPIPSSKKKSFSSDVMVVGEPSLMGGEFCDEDERMITRLENQFEPTNGPVKSEHQEPQSVNFPHATSPAVPSNSNPALWQSQMATQPVQQTGMNGPSLPNSAQPSSGPSSQNPSLNENNGQDTMPSTPLSAAS